MYIYTYVVHGERRIFYENVNFSLSPAAAALQRSGAENTVCSACTHTLSYAPGILFSPEGSRAGVIPPKGKDTGAGWRAGVRTPASAWRTPVCSEPFWTGAEISRNGGRRRDVYARYLYKNHAA